MNTKPSSIPLGDIEKALLSEHLRKRSCRLSPHGEPSLLLPGPCADKQARLSRRRTLLCYAATLCAMAFICWPLYAASPMSPFRIAPGESYGHIVDLNQKMLQR